MNINDYKDGNGNVEVSETLVSDLIGGINGVVESGSNENGSWVKFEDGTLLCYHTSSDGNVSISQSYGSFYIGYLSWEFPLVPIGLFSVQCSAKIEGIVTVTALNTNTSTTCSFYLINLLDNPIPAGNTEFNFFAIGKWK